MNERDELIKALQDILEVLPDEEAWRDLFGSKMDDAPMSSEEFINFTRILLDAVKNVSERG